MKKERKDFDRWCKLKKSLHEKSARVKIFFKEGEIWWVKCGANIGVESDGKGAEFTRPALVLRKISPSSALVVFLTSKDKSDSKHHTYLGKFSGKDSYLILSQVKTVDTARFAKRMLKLSNKRFSEVLKRFLKYHFPECCKIK